jgi:hypothetical protein
LNPNKYPYTLKTDLSLNEKEKKDEIAEMKKGVEFYRNYLGLSFLREGAGMLHSVLNTPTIHSQQPSSRLLIHRGETDDYVHQS